MLEFKVQDFGSIREGRVKLRPFTVFVGPNNSGKSYFAMLFYALLGTPQAIFGLRYRSGDEYLFHYRISPTLGEVDWKQIQNWAVSGVPESGKIPFMDLPVAARFFDVRSIAALLCLSEVVFSSEVWQC